MSIRHLARCGAAAASLVLPLAVCQPAGAAIISGEASLSGQFVPKTTFTDDTAPVAISEFSTVSGAPTGTLLGQVIVNGADDGSFSLGSFGQEAFDHESVFSFSDTIVNAGAADMTFTMDFVISAGALETIAREIPPQAGSDAPLQAGYEIVISSGADTLFESAATLSMFGDYPNTFDTTSSLVTSGTDLGGALTHPDLAAPDRWVYAWDDYTGSLDLGLLAAGGSLPLDYTVRTFVRAGIDTCASSDCAARASIGDPFHVNGDIPDDAQSSIGGPDTISSAPVVSVPEPGTLGLFSLGLLGLGFTTRRRRAR